MRVTLGIINTARCCTKATYSFLYQGMVFVNYGNLLLVRATCFSGYPDQIAVYLVCTVRTLAVYTGVH